MFVQFLLYCSYGDWPSNFFRLGANDADNDDLVWNVDWGDPAMGSSVAYSAPGNVHMGTGQNWNYNTSHTWTTAGTYTAKVNVSQL